MRKLLPLLLFFSASVAAAEPSGGCSADLTLSSGEHEMGHDELTRRFLLDLPATSGDSPPALLVAIHGYTGSPEIIGAPTTDQFVDQATQAGYVMVRPASTVFMADLNPITAETMGYIQDESEWADFPASARRVEVASWNDLAASKTEGPAGPICLPDAGTYPCPPECGDCGPCVWASCHDDVGFIEALIDELDGQVCFDRARRYVLGHSNGGMLAHALTCELPGLFAGGASIKGQPEIGYACDNPRSPSFIHITGGRDSTVPHDGGPASDGFLYETSHQSALTRASALSCQAGPRTASAAVEEPVTCSLWEECKDGRRIADCVDPDGGHEWPSNQEQGQWGMDLVYGFWNGSEILPPADP